MLFRARGDVAPGADCRTRGALGRAHRRGRRGCEEVRAATGAGHADSRERIGLLALRVSDLPRSAAFYRDHLGGRIRSQSSNSTFLDVGSQWVALFGRGAVSTGYEATQSGVDHISFHSSKHRSLAERMGVLRDHGLDPVSPAGSDRVYFRDPDGIILQLS